MANHPGDRLGSCTQQPCSPNTDVLNPVITCPPAITVNYSTSTATSVTGSASATDNSGTVLITYSDVKNQGTNVATSTYYNYSITRTWKATDPSGNFSTCAQVITVQDITKPVITCPANVTVSCGASVNTSTTGTATATDNSNSAINITNTDVINGLIITRTWKATDVSGNFSTCVQTITQSGSLITTVTSIPTNSTFTGGISTNLFLGYGAQSTTLNVSVPAGTYTYAWSGTGISKLNNTNTSNPVFTPTAAGSYAFTVVITSNSGCISTGTISICVTDIRVTTMTEGGDSDDEKDCDHKQHDASECSHKGHNHKACDHKSHSKYDCDHKDNDYGDVEEKDCDHSAHTSANCTHQYHNHAACNHTAHTSATCSHNKAYSSESTVCDHKSHNGDLCTHTGHTHIACDHKSHNALFCNHAISNRPNYTSCSHTSHGAKDCPHKDHNHKACTHTAHNAYDCDHDKSYGYDSKKCDHKSHSATNCSHYGHNHKSCNHSAHEPKDCSHNGGTDSDDHDEDAGQKVNICHVPPGNPGNPLTLSISINAVADHLANHPGDRLGSCTQQPCGPNTDVVNPVITCPPAITVNYTTSTATPVTGSASATDNSGTVLITNTDVSTQGTNIATGTYYNYTITRTWKATDPSGNFSICAQVITVQDITKPVITCPGNIAVACSGSTTTSVTGLATATDNSGGTVAIIYTDVTTTSSVTRTWKATDISGNFITCVQTISIVDNIAPVITCPANRILACGVSTAPATCGTATATDNCTGTVTITYTDVLSGNLTTRTWKATDISGNFSTCVQTLTIVDNIAPVITCPVNVSLACGVSTLPATCGTATATDNCSGSVTITYSDAVSGNVTSRTWKATDAAGNFSTCIQTLTLVDNVKPVITCPVNITIACAGTATGTATATDNCSGTVAITYTDVVSGKVTTRTWKATDASGNFSTCTQTITLSDNIAPVVTAPAAITVNCNASTLPAATGTATATDNCSGTVAITYTDVTSGNVITRTWTATDASGNISTKTQTITIGAVFTTSISSVPTSSTYTGGVTTNLYLGYGAQTTNLTIGSLPTTGAPYTYVWTGTYTNKLSSTTSSNPLFTPGVFDYYTFGVKVTNKYGCTATASISICVRDIRVVGTSGSTAKVYLCHKPYTWSSYTETKQVLISDVPAHIGNGTTNTCGSSNGDVLGSCGQTACNASTVTADKPDVIVVGKKEVAADVNTTEEELKVTVMPNPTTTYFTIRFESKYDEPINMRVMDGRGRVVDAASNIGANSTIQIGHNYSSGTYYAEMIQGTRVKKRKVIQLVKGRG